MSAKSLLESVLTKLGLYRLSDNGHGSNSGITEWWVISAVSVVNSFVKPWNTRQECLHRWCNVVGYFALCPASIHFINAPSLRRDYFTGLLSNLKFYAWYNKSKWKWPRRAADVRNRSLLFSRGYYTRCVVAIYCLRPRAPVTYYINNARWSFPRVGACARRGARLVFSAVVRERERESHNEASIKRTCSRLRRASCIRIIARGIHSNLGALRRYSDAIPRARALVGEERSFDFPTAPAAHPTKLIYTGFGDYQSPRTHLIYPTREVRPFKYAYPNG